MTIITKTLAVHSIQKSMVGTEQRGKTLFILLSSGKICRIDTECEGNTRKIDNTLHMYPSECRENNSVDLQFSYSMYVSD